MNPNSTNHQLSNIDITQPNVFPKFIKGITFTKFRHIENLDVDFRNPVSVIAGSNKSGKSTLLMAIACSHLKFEKRSFNTGKLERRTWSSYIRFTGHDLQTEDWIYSINYKTGARDSIREGKRRHDTKKWSGVGKKESQIKERHVVLLDVDRIVPARTVSNKIPRRTVEQNDIEIMSRIEDLKQYLSYIYETQYEVENSVDYSDKKMFNLINNGSYSSFNTASGEDVILNMLTEILATPSGSLILIDEIEIGLHPKIQRRLMDIIKHICLEETKQFIITTHSPTVYNSVSEESRIFLIYRNNEWKSKYGMNINAAMTTMDSTSYPLIDLFCEDKEANKVIDKALQSIMINRDIENINNYVNHMRIGSASNTYTAFIVHRDTYDRKHIKSGYACVLDGDMRNKIDKNSNLLYPPESNLHFLFDGSNPEKFMVGKYLELNPNQQLKYHLESSNNHILFSKMVEEGLATSVSHAFEICFEAMMQTEDGRNEMQMLEDFIIRICSSYSEEL